MLGSLVEIDDYISGTNINLEVRNIRISVKQQRTTVTYELYDPNQPIEQFNSNITVPSPSSHKGEFVELDEYNKDIQEKQNSTKLSVKTKIKGDVNYLTGVPVKDESVN